MICFEVVVVTIVKIMVGSRVWDGKILHRESPILHHECRSGAKRSVGTNGEGLEMSGEGFSHPIRVTLP